MILYLHGLNSSSASSKAQATLAYCGRKSIECHAPDLPHHPSEAAKLMEGLCAKGDGVVAVGSSMGGFYATWLVEKGLAESAVLVNPAVSLADKLSEYVGKEQQNYHDGSTYVFTQGHVDKLREMEVDEVADPSRYLLLVQTGDEVIDYREAVRFYEGCEQVVEQGGDHSFEGFERHLDRIAKIVSPT